MSGSVKQIIVNADTLTASYQASVSARVSDNDQHSFDVLYTPGESGNVLDFYFEHSSDDESVTDANAKWVKQMEWNNSSPRTKTDIDHQFTASGTSEVKLNVEFNKQCKRIRAQYKETGDGSPLYGTLTIRHLSRPSSA